MDYNQYFKLVKQRGAMTSDEQVETAICSVLEVLGERLTPDKAADLGALLPRELKPYLKRNEESEELGLEEFLERIGQKEELDSTIAFYHARAVLSGLGTALPANELSQALSQLPGDIRDLFMVENWVRKAA